MTNGSISVEDDWRRRIFENGVVGEYAKIKWLMMVLLLKMKKVERRWLIVDMRNYRWQEEIT